MRVRWEFEKVAAAGGRCICAVEHMSCTRSIAVAQRTQSLPVPFKLASCAALYSVCRRGAKDVAALVQDVARCAEGLARAITRHMAREESEVLPLLMRRLCFPEQRHMIWRILRAMPLRLLERVMPWVAGESQALVIYSHVSGL